MHVVEFPGGCTYSAYYVMSWGAALIDFCANAVQSVCYPLEYPLCFGSQAPGTTYTIDWGDDSTQVFTYPNLPVSPNVVGHTYDPSCDSTGTAEGYVITVIATNACEVDTTINEQGPYYVSTPPEPEFTWDPSLVVCQEDSVIFTELITSGYQASGGTCTDDHIWQWTVQGSNNQSGPGYQVTGEMGDIFYFWDPQAGDSQIQVDFTQPGVYAVTLTVQNDFCSPTSHTEYVTVNPIPYVEDDTILICTGDSIDYFPDVPPNIVPPGTIFNWNIYSIGNASGATSGSGTSIEQGPLINLAETTEEVIYEVIPIAPGDCIGESFFLTVQVVPGVDIPDAELVVCDGGSFAYSPFNNPPAVIVPDGTNFEWSVVNNPNIQGRRRLQGHKPKLPMVH